MEIAVGTRFIASATKRPQQTDAINGRNKTDATNGRNKRPQQTPATNGRDKSRPYGVANGATARSKMPLT